MLAHTRVHPKGLQHLGIRRFWVTVALPDECKCIRVSMKLCAFCGWGTVVLHFCIGIEWHGKHSSCSDQGTDQSSCRAWRSGAAVLVGNSVCSRFGSILVSGNEFGYCLQEVTQIWGCCFPICLKQFLVLFVRMLPKNAPSGLYIALIVSEALYVSD